MRKLFAFGDSFTQGVGIDRDHTSTQPSKFAWPAVTAELLGIPELNYGVGGSSCQQITGTVTQCEFQPSDIVCIMWTPSMLRLPVFQYDVYDWSAVHQVGTWTLDKTADGYYDQDDFAKHCARYLYAKISFDNIMPYTALVEHAMVIRLADLHAKQYTKNVIHIHIDDASSIKQVATIPILQDTMFLDFDLYDQSIKDARLPCGHYNADVHNAFSDKLSQYIRKIY